MANNKKKEIDILLSDLEKINKSIDLCIDCELYGDLLQIIKLSKSASNFLSELPGNNGENPFSKSFGKLPVIKVTLPTQLVKQLRLKNKSIPFQGGETRNDQFLKYWSYLFWAKKIRAEIKRNNKDKWNELYDDLILCLENNIPTSKDTSLFKDSYILNLTRFTYLMELSAVATGEASHGYAERARHLLSVIYPSHDDPKRALYDRWIWWNKGMAYQHIGRNQKAVLEFNGVIKKYFDKGSTIEEKKKLIVSNESNSLEFLLNILPATLQRSAINLKQQLGYHALQTLADSDLLLDVFQNDPDTIYSSSVSNLRLRIDLLRLDAYQQLDSSDDVKKLLEQVYKNKKVFGGEGNSEWNLEEPSLPLIREKPSVAQTQLVEQIVTWFLEKTTGLESCEKLIGDLKKLSENSGERLTDNVMKKAKKLAKDIEKKADYFRKAIETMSGTDSYWEWIKDNSFDKRIYFSKWAQFLKHGISLSRELKEIEKHTSSEIEKSAEMLLEATIKLYQSHREKIPVRRSERKRRKGTLELERFRSDDLPDFVNGLSSFYKNMSSLLLKKEERNSGLGLKEIVENTLRKLREDKEPVDLFKGDHFRLLAALDEYEEEFSENQQIHALKRCNERLIWHKVDPDPKGGCLDCFKGENNLPNPSSFDGLLFCQEDIPRDQELLPYEKRNRFDLLCYDYESIMQDTEYHLTEYLERHSLHTPPQEALHFVGLQRWNSLTPAQGRSVGGGYFIYRTNSEGEVNLGIAIDPGFDYVRNLFRMGFSLMDVDIVLISHAHADHLWDFESMVQLLHELKGKKDIVHQLNVILTLGSYQRLAHIINNPKLRRFINPLVIDIRKEIEPDFFKKLGTNSQGFNDFFGFFDLNSLKNNSSRSNKEKVKQWRPALPNIEEHAKKTEIKIWPTRAYHDDYSDRSDSFGFIIKVKSLERSDSSVKEFSFGYTGDTKWVGNDLYNQGCPADYNDFGKKCSVDSPRWEDVASQYTDCDVLLMHLGSIIDHKNKDEKKQSFSYYGSAKNCEELIREKDHPYLMGLIRFLRELYKKPAKKKLILMGEFGEELRGGIRTDLVKRLRQGLTEKWGMLPVDVGLDILLHDYADTRSQEGEKYKFLCALCDKHRPLSEVDYLRFGPDEAIFYTCKTCKKAIPSDVRDTRLRQLYDIGRELRTLPQSN